MIQPRRGNEPDVGSDAVIRNKARQRYSFGWCFNAGLYVASRPVAVSPKGTAES